MNSHMLELRAKMLNTGWFRETGCYTLFDGQYGSTGKGVLASVVAETIGDYIDTVTTNAGPNSGHTGYYQGEKILTQQLPVSSVVMGIRHIGHQCYLNGGAIIDPDILKREITQYLSPVTTLVVHPCAAVVKDEHKGDMNTNIASTGKGTGPAAMAKMDRDIDHVMMEHWPHTTKITPPNMGRCFVEVSQGWSLGINSGFYPYTTHRECGVSQALADLGVSPAAHRKSIACLRTYPIRVGNTPDGWSGPGYGDQEETTFEAIGQEPELTTVTKRVRRIFTWSDQQYMAMLQANRPDAIFLNFVNYLDERDVFLFVEDRVIEPYVRLMGRRPDFVLLGYGPTNEEVELWQGVH